MYKEDQEHFIFRLELDFSFLQFGNFGRKCQNLCRPKLAEATDWLSSEIHLTAEIWLKCLPKIRQHWRGSTTNFNSNILRLARVLAPLHGASTYG